MSSRSAQSPYKGRPLTGSAIAGRLAPDRHVHLNHCAFLDRDFSRGRKMPFSYLAGIVVSLPSFSSILGPAHKRSGMPTPPLAAPPRSHGNLRKPLGTPDAANR